MIRAIINRPLLFTSPLAASFKIITVRFETIRVLFKRAKLQDNLLKISEAKGRSVSQDAHIQLPVPGERQARFQLQMP
jgi:hypothetical protein